MTAMPDEAVEAAARALLDTEWDWRVIGPQKHATRNHYCADCPLCRPDYGDNAQRIVRVVLAAAAPLLREQIAREIESLESVSKDDAPWLYRDDIAAVVREVQS